MPELLWKSYIDFEISQEETDNARQLFERLLERTMHVKVNFSYLFDLIHKYVFSIASTFKNNISGMDSIC